MRIKGILLVLLTACLGAALAMAVSEQENYSVEVVGAITKNARILDKPNNAERPNEMQFDISTIKRHIPKRAHTTGLFEAKSWYSLHVQPARAYIPPPQAVTPPLPFSFIGRMIDGKEVTIFLSGNGHQYIAKENDVLDETYRVDKISEGVAVLTYLPTNSQQNLPFNSSLAGSALLSAPDLKTANPVIATQQPHPSN